MRSFDIKSLTEGGLLTALTVVAALISVYVPLLGIVTSLIWPLPIIVLIVRHGLRWGIISTIASCIIMSILIEPMLALRMILGFALPALVLGQGFRKEWPAARNLLAGLAVSIISTLAALGMVLVATGINPLDLQIDLLRESFDTAISFYETLGMSPTQIEESKTTFDQAFAMIGMLMPLVILTGSLLVTLANFIIGGKVLTRLGHPVTVLPPFNQWRLPRSVALAFGFALVGMYWGSTREITSLFQISLNVYVMTTVAGFVQGASMLSSLADRFRFSRWLFWLMITMIFLNGILAQIVSFAGLFDMLFDYRRRLNRNGDTQ